jgi:histidine ammonia-lyase
VTVVIGGPSLPLTSLVDAAGGAPVTLDGSAVARIEAGAARFAALAANGEAIYGYTTGLGALEREKVAAADNVEHQKRILRSHAAGVGPPMSDAAVRAMLLQRVHVLCRGQSGIRWPAVHAALQMISRDVLPIVPEAGSVGASDCAPLAHAALVLIGEGRARVRGEVLSGKDALARVGLAPIELAGRDAFALINGLSQSIALGALAVGRAECVVELADVICALGLAARGAPHDFLDPRSAAAKGHAAHADSAARQRALIAGAVRRSALLRTTLSTRYAPSVHGAATAATAHAHDVVQIEIDAVIDNPMLLGGDLTSNSGTTGGQELALALDQLAFGLAGVAAASERRTDVLLDGSRSGLPPFLIDPRTSRGLSSGLMMVQVTAAAIVAEMRSRAVPASLQSIPTGAGTEDHVSMSAVAARHATWVVDQLELLLAIELLCACQAADLAGGPPPMLIPIHQRVRAVVPHMIDDRVVGDDIAAVHRLVHEGVLS